jgi:manganese/zinc/iron transport system substrate-binding protein
MYIKLLLLVSFFVFSGCDVSRFREERKKTLEWMYSNNRLKALCTTVFVGSLVRSVGGEYVDVLDLIPSESDPHMYRLVKGDSEKFTRADVCFHSGLGLEVSLSLNKQLKKHNSLSVADEIAHQNGCIFLGTTPDPHMWMDLSLWAVGAKIIAKKLAEVDKKHEKEFLTNAETVEKRLLDLHQKILEKMSAIPEENRYLVTTHDAFHYFAKAYLAENNEKEQAAWMKRILAPEGLAPESEISLQTIREVVSYIKEHHVRSVFVEFAINKDSVEKIVQACDSRVDLVREPLYSDSILSSMTYEKAMEHNSNVIFTALKCPLG